LYRVVTSDEMWMYFDDPNCKNSSTNTGQSSTLQPVHNTYENKALLYIWLDNGRAVYHKLLKFVEMIDTDNN